MTRQNQRIIAILALIYVGGPGFVVMELLWFDRWLFDGTIIQCNVQPWAPPIVLLSCYLGGILSTLFWKAMS